MDILFQVLFYILGIVFGTLGASFVLQIFFAIPTTIKLNKHKSLLTNAKAIYTFSFISILINIIIIAIILFCIYVFFYKYFIAFCVGLGTMCVLAFLRSGNNPDNISDYMRVHSKNISNLVLASSIISNITLENTINTNNIKINNESIDLQKSKTKGNNELRILAALLIIFLIYLSMAGEYLNNYEFVQASALAFIDTCLITLLMIFIPGIIRIIKKERLNYNWGCRIALANSIIIFLISFIVSYSLDTNIGIGGLGAILYFFINMLLFAKPYTKPDKSINNKNTNYDIDNNNIPKDEIKPIVYDYDKYNMLFTNIINDKERLIKIIMGEEVIDEKIYLGRNIPEKHTTISDYYDFTDYAVSIYPDLEKYYDK